MRRAPAHKYDVSIACGSQKTNAWHTVGMQQISSDWLRHRGVLKAMTGSHVGSATPPHCLWFYLFKTTFWKLQEIKRIPSDWIHFQRKQVSLHFFNGHIRQSDSEMGQLGSCPWSQYTGSTKLPWNISEYRAIDTGLHGWLHTKRWKGQMCPNPTEEPKSFRRNTHAHTHAFLWTVSQPLTNKDYQSKRERVISPHISLGPGHTHIETQESKVWTVCFPPGKGSTRI